MPAVLALQGHEAGGPGRLVVKPRAVRLEASLITLAQFGKLLRNRRTDRRCSKRWVVRSLPLCYACKRSLTGQKKLERVDTAILAGLEHGDQSQ